MFRAVTTRPALRIKCSGYILIISMTATTKIMPKSVSIKAQKKSVRKRTELFSIDAGNMLIKSSNHPLSITDYAVQGRGGGGEGSGTSWHWSFSVACQTDNTVILLIQEAYIDARFIRIYRDPYHIWDEDLMRSDGSHVSSVSSSNSHDCSQKITSVTKLSIFFSYVSMPTDCSDWFENNRF